MDRQQQEERKVRREGETQRELTVLVGLPGSGKSSWAEKHLPGQVIVSPDQVRYEEFGVQFDQQVESQVWQIVLAKVEGQLILARPVVFDATNLTIKRRKVLINLGRQYGAFLRAVLINTSVSACLRQNRSRRKFEQVPDNLILRMAKTLVKPKQEEGFDEVIVVQPATLRLRTRQFNQI